MEGFCLKCNVPRPCACLLGAASRDDAYLRAIMAFLAKSPSPPSNLVLVDGSVELHIGDLRAVTAAASFTHVVTLLSEDVPPVPADKRVPCLDTPDQDIVGPLEEVYQYLKPVLAAGDARILIACVEGRSRSAAVTIGVLMRWRSMPFDDALALLREKRPRINPQASFLEALKQQQQQQ